MKFTKRILNFFDFLPKRINEIFISKEVIESVIGLAKTTYPKEVLVFLGGVNKDNKLFIKELLFQPYYASEDSALTQIMFPILNDVIGSCHSHPHGSSRPSSADSTFFSKNPGIHLIISYPFRVEDISAYNIHGEKIEFKIS